MSALHDLRLGLAAFALLGPPGKITKVLQGEGCTGLERIWGAAPAEVQDEIAAEAEYLARQEVGAVLFGDDDYPSSLVSSGRPVAPVIFCMGNRKMLNAAGIGMCGSRAATPLGLKAAQACGHEVSLRDLVVISGYAKGVDTETHLAALKAGGRTVIVLAEGFNHFRVKRAFADDFDPGRVLVLSQFPPKQRWTAYNAMARNRIIFGLGQALVVIEAGERGGTLAAGEGALRLGRPVFVLDFGVETPPGNRLLLDRGARPVKSRTDLGSALDRLAMGCAVQGELPL